MRQFSSLVRTVGKSLDDDLLGRGKVRIPWGTFAMIAPATVYAEDLLTALGRLCRFCQIQPVGPIVRLVPHNETIRFECDPDRLRDPDGFMGMFTLAMAHAYGSWLVGRQLPVRDVEVPYPHDWRTEDYGVFLPITPRFNRPRLALTFEADALLQPVIQNHLSLGRLLERLPGDLLSRRENCPSMNQQVRRILENSLHGKPATLEAVAAALNMSPATLRRRLADEHTCFAQVRQQFLSELAISGLTSGASIGGVAKRLGFSEPSAFRRAFKRWTGVTAGAYLPGGSRCTPQRIAPALNHRA